MTVWVVWYELRDDVGRFVAPQRLFCWSYDRAERVAADLRRDVSVVASSVVIR